MHCSPQIEAQRKGGYTMQIESIGSVFHKLKDPEVRYKMDVMMAKVLIKDLYKKDMIDEKTYEKAIQNADIALARSDKNVIMSTKLGKKEP